MLNALSMPAWLVDFWTVYGDMITPVLVTLLLSIVTWLAIKIKADAKYNAAKTEAQIEALKQINEREDTTPQLEKQATEIKELTNSITYLSEMFQLAFKNSELNPEIKNQLETILNKIKYGTTENVVQVLEDEKLKLQQQIEELKSKLNTPVTLSQAPAETKVRTRR